MGKLKLEGKIPGKDSKKKTNSYSIKTEEDISIEELIKRIRGKILHIKQQKAKANNAGKHNPHY